MLLPFLVASVGLGVSIPPVSAAPQAQSSSGSVTATATAPPSTAVPTITGAALSSTLALPAPSVLPPRQTWCPSSIFCAGELLQTLNLAMPYVDSKTIVDKPTNKSSVEVLNDFQKIVSQGGSDDVVLGQLVQFLNDDFRGEGQELVAQSLPSFVANPPQLGNISDPLISAFAHTVHGFWNDLIRGTDPEELCTEGNSTKCESSLIPLNHTFVVPGGRFREQYYWDSYWILRGLAVSSLPDIINDTLQNFMDEIDTRGFIPNGGRIYYLDRSQPPLFVRMLSDFLVAFPNETSILTRALPLATKEMTWWATNRLVNITSPFTKQVRSVYKYAVVNSAPRPESYLADYLVTNGPDLTTPYTQAQREALWAELASGAETGWDYTARWIEPSSLTNINTSDNTPLLRGLNVRELVPVDLNSILYDAHLRLSQLYTVSSLPNKGSLAASHLSTAIALKASILDLFWDPSKLAFYDFNTTASARNSVFSVATFYPLWSNIIPNEILTSETNAQGYFATVPMVLARYNGTFPTTFIETGLQWDAPNAWPPHQFIVLEALRNLPANVSGGQLPNVDSGKSRYSLVPNGQLNIDEDKLPTQTMEDGNSFPASGSDADINFLSSNGTFVNAGNVAVGGGTGWRDLLVTGLANRYVASTLCSWQVSGGSIPDLLPQLPPGQRLPGSENLTGLMFEKFSSNDISSAGRGGEYTVQAGFGWTNGVLLWAANEFGDKLVKPQCPVLENTSSNNGGGSSGGGAGGGGSNGGTTNGALGQARFSLGEIMSVTSMIAAIVLFW